jgi:hypothetical protein
MWHPKISLPVRWPLSLAILMLALVGSGCSQFHGEWRAAAKQAPPADAIVGRWQGSWKSVPSGHTDKLRCLVTKLDDTRYQAWFHAKYHTIFSFAYKVELRVEKQTSEFQFKGSADLGKLAGGVYTYDGHANATNFFSTYTAKLDHGTFQMTRPK